MSVGRFEWRDGVPYHVRPMSAAEAMDESCPLPRLALYALGWTDAEIDAAVGADGEHMSRGRSDD